MLSWIALNMVEGLKPVHRAALLRSFGSAENVFQMTELDLSAVADMKPEFAYRIAHFDFRMAEQELSRAKHAGFGLVCLTDSGYPELLKTIPDPPVVLYIYGEVRSQEMTVALVGSRKATPYGLNVTQFLAQDLGAAGVTVVSGLARGIDARAHSAALQAGARTIAVLGSGLDCMYPSEHKLLAQKIARKGAVITEFPLGTPPNRENFPIRNRIISGLSYAVVVVEASDKSGSLITARMAAEQGREILAVPGSIFNESSKGCHSLIKDGAAVVRDWKDIIAELPESFSSQLRAKEVEKPVLTDLERTVVDLLSFEQPKHIDQITVLMGGRSQDLSSALVSLELKTYITQMPGKHFLRVK